MIERRTITFCDLEHPAYEARGDADGPHIALIGGVHGCEYSSIAAVTRFMNELDTRELAGSITAVPIVSMESFRQRSPFVVPADGKNLNRSFPGSRDGTYTDRLAASIFEQVIEPADVLLDLHGGDLVEALEPFAIYDASPHEERTHALALAFGLPYVVRQEVDESGLGGMTSSAAARAGIPAVIAEAGGCGQLEESATSLLVAGVRNVLRHLEVLPGDPAPPRSRVVGKFVWFRASQDGWWQPTVAAGDEVTEGQLVGSLRTLYGDVLEELRAPRDGVVLFLTTSPAVRVDGPLLGLGAELSG
ncbi:MAG TPA: succinylglutamate desuccinylase/aspartoacylase family protein [Gaiellaceae bacterium]|nr:succinylglutamate desuccinylase/aspartoacylase family protein [Gaiellaceae bacterium]